MKDLGLLHWDEYDQIDEVIEWVLNVIPFNLFVEPPATAGVHKFTPYWDELV